MLANVRVQRHLHCQLLCGYAAMLHGVAFVNKFYSEDW